MNKKPTEKDWQQYKHQYLLEVQRSANEDADKLFDRANAIDQQITSSLVTVAGVVLTIAGSILATKEVELSFTGKVAFATGVVFLFLSILAGLWEFKAKQSFYNKWAKARHERGGLVEHADIITFDDLAAFRKEQMEVERRLPQSSPKLPGTLQFIYFAAGMLSIVVAIFAVLFNF